MAPAIKTAAAILADTDPFSPLNQNLTWEISPSEEYFYSTFWLPPLKKNLFSSFPDFSFGEQASYFLTPEGT